MSVQGAVRRVIGCTIALVAIAMSSKTAMRLDGGRAPIRWFVASGVAGTSDGSIQRPFRTIREAVAAARDGDTIAVAAGRYPEGTIDLRSKSLTLLGGFAGAAGDGNSPNFMTRDPQATPSVVVGVRDTDDYKRNPAAVFLLGDSDGGRIDGFTVTGGRHGIFAQYSGSAEPLVIANNIIEDNGIDMPLYDEFGGGIHSEYKSLVITHNIIRRNRSGRGGGLAALGTGDARIEMNLIEENVALGDHGGGMYVQQPATVRGNVVRANAVTAVIVNWMGGVGGGITIVAAEASLSNNFVTDNYAKKCGGGMFLDEGATVTLQHEVVTGNRPADTHGWGGSGIYVDGSAAVITRVRIADSLVVDNAPNGPGVGNSLFIASRAQVTVDDSIIQNDGTKADLAIIDDTGTSFVTMSNSFSIAPGLGVDKR